MLLVLYIRFVPSPICAQVLCNPIRQTKSCTSCHNWRVSLCIDDYICVFIRQRDIREEQNRKHRRECTHIFDAEPPQEESQIESRIRNKVERQKTPASYGLCQHPEKGTMQHTLQARLQSCILHASYAEARHGSLSCGTDTTHAHWRACDVHFQPKTAATQTELLTLLLSRSLSQTPAMAAHRESPSYQNVYIW